jgi:hypothetical protein
VRGGREQQKRVLGQIYYLAVTAYRICRPFFLGCR